MTKCWQYGTKAMQFLHVLEMSTTVTVKGILATHRPIRPVRLEPVVMQSFHDKMLFVSFVSDLI